MVFLGYFSVFFSSEKDVRRFSTTGNWEVHARARVVNAVLYEPMTLSALDGREGGGV